MRRSIRQICLLSLFVLLVSNIFVMAQDWPQWRGQNRDAKVTDFTAPQTWPKELTQKWKVTVGEGTDSTPVLVEDKLYFFTRKAEEEVLLCLDAGTGEEIWSDTYTTPGTSGADRGHSGPRSTPAIANGKIYTLGVNGILSCLDLETQKVVWRKDDFPGAFPRFHTAMSPVIVDNMCIGHFGNASNGAIVAYDTATGEQKWKWSGGEGFGPSYASPIVTTLGGTKQVIVQTERNVVSVSVKDGTLLWQEASAGGRYAASSPVVDETNSVVFGMRGNGCYAIKIVKEGDNFKTEQLWSNEQIGAEYCTSVLKNDLLFGLTASNNYYCLNAKTGTAAWSVSANSAATTQSFPQSEDSFIVSAAYYGNSTIAPVAFGGMGRGGGMGRRGGMGGGGYATIVDAGSVLFGLTSNASLVVVEPSDKEFKELARYRVSDGQTYAYPIITGNRIFISDQTSVALWTIE